MRKCLLHTNHWLWWFISFEHNYFFVKLCHWSFIILSILFINNLDLASCWYLIYMYMMHIPAENDVHIEAYTYTYVYVAWPENGQLIKNPLVFVFQCWVMLLLTDINRNKWMSSRIRWLLYRSIVAVYTEKWCPNNGTAVRKTKNIQSTKSRLQNSIYQR